MPLTFYAEDDQFAASTGANVNNGHSGPGTSQFDYPPNATHSLTITSHVGDTDPRLFEVGETYTVSWDGMGGATTITNATVVRSDDLDAPGTQGAIVFEGLDQNGDLAQLVWSPQFDLEGWYWDNFSGGQPPGFYTTDQVAGDHHFACFLAGTFIETPNGPALIETLNPGNLVNTLDHGPQPVLWHATSTVPGFGRAAPVEIDAGVLGNSAPLIVSPQHRILVSDLLVEVCFGDREVLVPAKSLVDRDKAKQCTRPEVEYHHLLLERHEIVFANDVPTESLFLGDDPRPLMQDEAYAVFQSVSQSPAGVWGRKPRKTKAARQLLTVQQGAVLRPALGLRKTPVPAKVPALLIPA